MTETPAVSPSSDSAQFLQVWSESTSEVLGKVAGIPFTCSVTQEKPAELPPAAETDQWNVMTASGALRGEMSLRLSSAAILRLGQIFMSEPPAPDAQLTSDHSESVAELLRQIAGVVSTSAKARWGVFQLLVEAAISAPSWPPAETFWLRAADDSANPIFLEFGLSAALVAQLRVQPSDAATEPAPNVATSVSAAAEPESSQVPATLDLLKDVQLSMTLRFGSRTLPLRDVLDLGPGSVVELDRRVQEPVELLLDGKLIARGEVVVIERSYGLRVTEIPPPTNP